jgi:hypothetical protein
MMNDSNREGVNKMNKNTDEVEVEVLELDELDAFEVTEDEDEATDEEVTFSPKEIASELGITAKDFRRWLRSKTDRRANKGGRWVFTADEKADWIQAYNSKDEAAEATEEDAEV